jgi:hypothetical protein
MRWSRRHSHLAWMGTVALLALLFLGVRDMGMESGGGLVVAVTMVCAFALIGGDLVAVIVHRIGGHPRR